MRIDSFHSRNNSSGYIFLVFYFADDKLKFKDTKRVVQGHSRTWSRDAKPGVWDMEGPTSSHVTNRVSVGARMGACTPTISPEQILEGCASIYHDTDFLLCSVHTWNM